MALSFDGSTKRVIISSATTLSVRDLWSRAVDWWLTGDNSKYEFPMTQVGGDDIDISAGTKIPIYAFLRSGWRVKPQESSHTLNVTDGILLVDGGGDPFVSTTGSFVVRVNYQQPVQAISFSSGGGGGGLTTEQAAMLADLHKVHGLLVGTPLQVSDSARVAGDITQNIVEVAGVVTVSRA